MKLADQRTLLAQAVFSLLIAKEKGISLDGVLTSVGFYLNFASGRKWDESLQKLVDHVQQAQEKENEEASTPNTTAV